MTDPAHTDEYFLGLAIEQAQIGWEEGGVPIGAALVHDGEVLAVGRNRRVQMDSAIRHGETDCIERAGEMVCGLGPVMAMARYRDESGTDGLASPET